MPFETCLVNTRARWMTLPFLLDDKYALLVVNICACPSLEVPVLMYQGCVLAGWGDKCKNFRPAAVGIYSLYFYDNIYVYLWVINACYSVNRSFEENGSFNPGKEIKAETQTYYQALIDNRDSPFIVSFSFPCHITIILIMVVELSGVQFHL